jgi:hypothetical protein
MMFRHGRYFLVLVTRDIKEKMIEVDIAGMMVRTDDTARCEVKSEE